MTPSSGLAVPSRIQFEDATGGTSANTGGVYSVRQRSPSGTGSVRPSSLNRHDSKEIDLEAESNAVFDRDVKQNQVRYGLHLPDFATYPNKLTGFQRRLLGLVPSHDPTHVVDITDPMYEGLPISLSVSCTVILARHLCTCTRQRSLPILHIRTWSAFYRSSSGPSS